MRGGNDPRRVTALSRPLLRPYWSCTVPLLKTEGRPCSRAPRSAASAAWETLVSGDTGPPRWEAPNVAQPLSLASRSAFVNCRYRKGCGGLQLYGDKTIGKTTKGTCEACDQVIPSPRREKRPRPTPYRCAFPSAGPLQDPCSDVEGAGVRRSPLNTPSDALCASLITCGPNPRRHSASRATT